MDNDDGPDERRDDRVRADVTSSLMSERSCGGQAPVELAHDERMEVRLVSDLQKLKAS